MNAKKNSSSRIGCFIAFGLLFILPIGGIFIFSAYIHQRIVENLSAEEDQFLTQFFQEPIDFPEEWGVIVPYSEGFENERERMKAELLKWEGREKELMTPMREWKPVPTDSSPDPYPISRDYLGLLQSGETLTDEELEIAQDYLKSTSEYVRAWRRFVNHPEYELMATPILEEDVKPGYTIPNFLFPQCAVRGIGLGLEINRAELDESERIALCLHMIRIGKNRPVPIVIGYLIEIAIKFIGLNSIQSEIPSIEDPALLKEIYSALEKNEVSALITSLLDQTTVDFLGSMRFAERQGDFDFDFTPGKPLVDYFHQLLQPGAPIFELIDDQSDRFSYAPFIDIPVEIDFRWIVKKPFLSSILGLEEGLVVGQFTNSWFNLPIRSNYCGVTLNLTRLQVANRIRELETGKKTEDPSGFVPEFFSSVPTDPFVDKPFVWDSTREVFYSIGPDESDDRNLIRYNPTNGTESVGDISVWVDRN